ncbi:MAG TPA: response regulator transcription factor, partial [Lacipirellulaceae bacterium]|nr:response regulator transcription factor [Lacipirellulaceae bacterium]
YRPDVVLLDVRMVGGDGLAALGRLRGELPQVPVVMFSGYDNPTYMARAAALGAAGYVVKSAGGEEIAAAVTQAAAGETLWPRGGPRRMLSAAAATRSADLETALTRRENEVLKQLALGLSNKEIAQALNISYETVKEHVQHILRKLGVADRTQAAVWAVRKGLA